MEYLWRKWSWIRRILDKTSSNSRRRGTEICTLRLRESWEMVVGVGLSSLIRKCKQQPHSPCWSSYIRYYLLQIDIINGGWDGLFICSLHYQNFCYLISKSFSCSMVQPSFMLLKIIISTLRKIFFRTNSDSWPSVLDSKESISFWSDTSPLNLWQGYEK